MSAEHAKQFYEKVASDPALRAEVKKHFGEIQKLAKKHGLDFTHAEYFDYVHSHTGMSKVGKASDHDGTDTCFTMVLSEPPRA